MDWGIGHLTVVVGQGRQLAMRRDKKAESPLPTSRQGSKNARLPHVLGKGYMVNLGACPCFTRPRWGGGGVPLTGARARIVEMSNSEAAICIDIQGPRRKRGWGGGGFSPPLFWKF